MHDDRVDPRGHEERVEEVGLEARALGDRARHDRAGRGRERPLEDPLVVLRGAGRAALGERGHAEELRADEGVGGRAVSVGEGVAKLFFFLVFFSFSAFISPSLLQLHLLSLHSPSSSFSLERERER